MTIITSVDLVLVDMAVLSSELYRFYRWSFASQIFCHRTPIHREVQAESRKCKVNAILFPTNHEVSDKESIRRFSHPFVRVKLFFAPN